MKKVFLLILGLFVFSSLLSEQNENNSKAFLKSKLQLFDHYELEKLQEILNNYKDFNDSNKEFILVDTLILMDSAREKVVALDTIEFKGREVPLAQADSLRKEFLRKKFEELTEKNNELFKECLHCKGFIDDLDNLHVIFDGNNLLANPEKMESKASEVMINNDIAMIRLQPSEHEKKADYFTRLLLHESQECIQEIMNKKNEK